MRFALHMSLLSNFRSFFIQLSFLLLSAIRRWLSAPTFMVKAVDLQRRSLLLLRLLFMAAPAAALHGCSCGWSSWLLPRRLSGYFSGYSFGCSCGCCFWLLLRALFLAASAVLFSATSTSALVGCFYWCSCSPASEDAPTMAAASASAFM